MRSAARHFSVMANGDPERRYVVERRLRRDRRRGLERRIADRRLQYQWAAFERRMVPERRRGLERRGPIARRGWLERRGPGVRWVDPFPT
jgi:hypothetical protein